MGGGGVLLLLFHLVLLLVLLVMETAAFKQTGQGGLVVKTLQLGGI